jgi:type IV pilus assembly protein PilA
MKKFKSQKGFTLIEILVVIGIIAVLAVIVLIAINPGRQFAQSRNTQRTSNVNAILNAIGQNMADNKGVFTCAGTSAAVLDSTDRIIKYVASPTAGATYMSELPYDPSAAGAHMTSATDYDTQYTVSQDATTKRITVKATTVELSQPISLTR